ASAARVLNSEPTVERKLTIARAEDDVPRKVEQLRELLYEWHRRSQVSRVAEPPLVVGAAAADEDAFIAAVTLDGRKHLLVGCAQYVTNALSGQLRVCSLPASSDAPVDERAVLAAVDSL